MATNYNKKSSATSQQRTNNRGTTSVLPQPRDIGPHGVHKPYPRTITGAPVAAYLNLHLFSAQLTECNSLTVLSIGLQHPPTLLGSRQGYLIPVITFNFSFSLIIPLYCVKVNYFFHFCIDFFII